MTVRTHLATIRSAALISGLCLISLTTINIPKTYGDTLMKLHAITYNQVQITDDFWQPQMETNRKITIPYMLDMLEKTNSIKNFELAAQHATEGYTGPPWADSDVYKALETASYALATHPDPALDHRIDGIIAKISAAQQDDGYINTCFQVQLVGERWTDLALKHEMYTAGHMFEAAVAHFQATGKRTFLDVAIRMADHIDSVFGDAPGKRIGYCGHPEIELALIKLWHVTGEKRYFDLASFFVEQRGQGLLKVPPPTPLDSVYFLDDMPIREHKTIKGHAVRALYLFSSVADIAMETGDRGLIDMLETVWRNTVELRMYVTGGVGPGGGIEGFTHDYDLPNLNAYQETCASVGMAMWNQRMGILHGDAKYIDIMEKSLYNGVLAGISLDGMKFYYSNPLSSAGDFERSEWFGCACCPPNVARTISMIGGYIYAAGDDSILVNLYIGNKAQIKVGSNSVNISMKTDYPWNGKVKIKIDPKQPATFALKLRIPSWCTKASADVNGEGIVKPAIDKGYMVINREWQPGDVVDLNLPMDVMQMEAHPRAVEDLNRLALQRGPLVYCIEGCDQSAPISKIAVPRGAKFRAVKKPDLLGGIVTLQGEGLVAPKWSNPDALYLPAQPDVKTPVSAIPYYAWNNRGKHAMEVWIPTSASRMAE
ncbi:MAG: glycoside hydrolase family 127 protein [Armatimonadota bacterium]